MHADSIETNPMFGFQHLGRADGGGLGRDGGNITGPTLIRAPSWVAKPLGKYYLYFAHHSGKYIRLAYADSFIELPEFEARAGQFPRYGFDPLLEFIRAPK